MKILVVDDEPPARRRLIRMLGEIAGLTVIGEAGDGLAALEQIRALRPELLFLDIQMPELDGISLALGHRELPPIIFCTAHDEFAVQAFEAHAVDYLLKPIRAERLERAIERARARVSDPAEVRKALEVLSPTPRSTRILSSARGRIRLFEAAEVTRFWSSDKYTLFVGDGEEQLSEEPLAALEERLAGQGFMRVHRAELVRLSAVRAIHQQDGTVELELSDGQRARVSRRSIASLKEALGL